MLSDPLLSQQLIKFCQQNVLPDCRMYDNGTRIREFIFDDSPLESSVEFTDIDFVEFIVTPIQLSADMRKYTTISLSSDWIDSTFVATVLSFDSGERRRIVKENTMDEEFSWNQENTEYIYAAELTNKYSKTTL